MFGRLTGEESRGAQAVAGKMSKTKSTSERNGINKEQCLGSVINRAFTCNSQWPDKDEFLDVIYWGRQVLGVALGLVWGFIPLKGFIGLFLFCVINAALVYFYASSFQGIDEEEFGGMWELTKEGFVTSFAGFLGWMSCYRQLFRPKQNKTPPTLSG